MKEIKINIPKGYEIDKEKSTFEKLIFKKTEDILPKSWEELDKIGGYYIDENANIEKINKSIRISSDENIFRTEQQAKSSLAMAQLSQLMDIYNDGWEPDWNNGNESKYAIERIENYIQEDLYSSIYHFLAFKTKKIRDEFSENFEDLIEQYLMIE